MGQPQSTAAGRSLGRSRLIGQLSTSSLDMLGAIARPIHLDKGETLFLQEDAGDALYVIESGSVEISILAENGRKLSLNVMRPPEVFGEIAALDGGRRTASATTLEPSALLMFERARLLVALEEEPAISTELIRILCARLRWVSRQVEDLVMLDMEARLASKMLILHRRFSDDEGRIRMSQSDLADFLGATRESINKILKKWRKEGLIKTSRGSIRVLDRPGLDRLVAEA